MPTPIQSSIRHERQTVLVAGDHALTRAGVAYAIDREPNLHICGESENLDGTLAQLGRLEPDLLILDISLRNGMAIGLIRECKERSPRLKILALSAYQELLYAGQALRAGAQGYMNRSAEVSTLIEAVRNVMKGQVYLSPDLTGQLVSNGNGSGGMDADPISRLTERERQVFEMVGQGLTGRVIARRLKISPHTVETYRERVKTKLGLENGAELTFRATVWMLMNQ